MPRRRNADTLELALDAYRARGAVLAVIALGIGCTALKDPNARPSDAGAAMDAAGADADAVRDGGGVLIGGCDNTTDDDGDGIYDEFETSDDFDGDGAPNLEDLDSDDDGLLDAEEHGRAEGCAAADIDGDGRADFVDLDADGDGLSDNEERTRHSTDPTNPDSDGDGFVDLAEIATDSDPNDPTSRIPEDTFYVVASYLGDAVDGEFAFGTTIRKADVFFMMDRTDSMSEEVAHLESSLGSLVSQMGMRLSDVGVGFGAFAGFGGEGAGGCIEGSVTCSDGEEGDMPFALVQPITTDLPQMQAGAASLAAIGYGGVSWASSNEALYLTVTGEGFPPWLSPQRCSAVPGERGQRYGYPCFRPGALPILFVMTDTASKNGPGATVTYDPAAFTMSARGPHTYGESRDAVSGIGGRVIGVVSGSEAGDPVAQFSVWARDTGTVDGAGSPLVFTIGANGNDLDARIVDAIRILSEETPQDVTASVIDGEDRPTEVGPVDAADFVQAITPLALVEGGIPTACPMAGVCDEAVFYTVTPGATVRLRVRFLNDFQTPRSFAQVFFAEIVVFGNGVARLDSREVVIAVPAGSALVLP